MKPPVPPFRVLPLLKERRRELETCVYCPKLCRSACPVSNAEPREALTPWGKMSGSYFVANDRVEAHASFTLLPWACTGCRACAGACDHKNPVADTLTDARAAMFASGLAPGAAVRVSKSFAEKQKTLDALTAEAKKRHDLGDGGSIGILAGCTYLRKTPDVADDAIASTIALSNERATLVSSCCGASLAMAGDREGQRAALKALAAETRALKRLVVADPGCAHAIKHGAETLGIEIAPRISLVIELAAESLEKLASPSGAGATHASSASSSPPRSSTTRVISGAGSVCTRRRARSSRGSQARLRVSSKTTASTRCAPAAAGFCRSRCRTSRARSRARASDKQKARRS
jgi:Fe-S oxidoreductase